MLGSHDFLITEFVKLMLSKTNDFSLVGNMKNSFIYLKTCRKKADYENVSISKKDVEDCKEKATFIKNKIDEFIKKNFAA